MTAKRARNLTERAWQETAVAAEELRAALARHGVTLPSLGVDAVTLAGRYGEPPLVALGNCSVGTARKLVAALGRGGEREGDR